MNWSCSGCQISIINPSWSMGVYGSFDGFLQKAFSFLICAHVFSPRLDLVSWSIKLHLNVPTNIVVRNWLWLTRDSHIDYMWCVCVCRHNNLSRLRNACTFKWYMFFFLFLEEWLKTNSSNFSLKIIIYFSYTTR